MRRVPLADSHVAAIRAFGAEQRYPAGTSSRIENYMGFPTGISGTDLTFRGQVQAMKFGTRFIMPRRVEALSRRDDGAFCVTLDGDGSVVVSAIWTYLDGLRQTA